jgi:uncharacterized protein YbaA (DUF1428 family)
MAYVDGFVIPMPKKNVKAYRRIAEESGRVWMKHGALEYHECVGEQLKVKNDKGKLVAPFPKMTRMKPSETVFFSWITYKSRAHPLPRGRGAPPAVSWGLREWPASPDRCHVDPGLLHAPARRIVRHAHGGRQGWSGYDPRGQARLLIG